MKALATGEMDELKAFFDLYSAAWLSNDAPAIARHWDPERFAFYKAEEVFEYYLDWNDVLAYWGHNEQFHSRVLLKFGPIRAVRMSESWVMAPVFMRWHITFAPEGRQMNGAPFPHRGSAMGGDNHILCLLSHATGGWKLCGWSETPDAPISYMARLYKYAASSTALGLSEGPPTPGE
jgi:hypothetical protein